MFYFFNFVCTAWHEVRTSQGKWKDACSGIEGSQAIEASVSKNIGIMMRSQTKIILEDLEVIAPVTALEFDRTDSLYVGM